MVADWTNGDIAQNQPKMLVAGVRDQAEVIENRKYSICRRKHHAAHRKFTEKLSSLSTCQDPLTTPWTSPSRPTTTISLCGLMKSQFLAIFEFSIHQAAIKLSSCVDVWKHPVSRSSSTGTFRCFGNNTARFWVLALAPLATARDCAHYSCEKFHSSSPLESSFGPSASSFRLKFQP
ncbi:hypothetical protein B0H12DRAFT_379703 [Mycena haematopus]|nr:hypothetical protein B0H12DRAFT_379703 [Mycena haematopus]